MLVSIDVPQFVQVSSYLHRHFLDYCSFRQVPVRMCLPEVPSLIMHQRLLYYFQTSSTIVHCFLLSCQIRIEAFPSTIHPSSNQVHLSKDLIRQGLLFVVLSALEVPSSKTSLMSTYLRHHQKVLTSLLTRLQVLPLIYLPRLPLV